MCRPRKTQDAPRPLDERGCTDCLCLLIFIAFLIVLLLIFIYALVAGDWNAFFYASDYLGNRCGTGEYAHLKKAFFPRIETDLASQQASLATSPWNLKLYALCVASCPTQFDINSPQVITDYGFDANSSVTLGLGSGTQPTWVSTLPTVDLINRCVPRTQVDESSRQLCAYPNCTSTDVDGLGVSCDAEYPSEWEVCASGTSSEACASQQAACLVQAEHIDAVSYEAYTSEDNGNSLVVLADTVGGFYTICKALADAYGYIIVGGVVAPVMAAFVFMLLLRFFARLIIYTLLVALVCFMTAVLIMCYIRSGMNIGGVNAKNIIAEASNNISVTNPTLNGLLTVQDGNEWIWTVAFWIMLLLTTLCIISIALARKKVKVVIAIVVESTKVFTALPSLMIAPTWSVLAQSAVYLWAISGLALLLTSKPESWQASLDLIPEEGSGSLQGIASGLEKWRQDQGDNATRLLVAIHILGFYWLVQFVQATAWTTMSGAVCHWYFFRNDKNEATRIPIMRSLYRVFRFHIGSMAFGSLIIALFQFLRAVLAYIDRHVANGNSLVLKIVFKCCQLCLWCLEKTIKFITYYGFVFVALRGDNFCSACYMTFSFIVSNPMQVATNSVVTRLLTLSCIFTIPVGCCIGTYYYVNTQTDVIDSIYPAAAVLLLAGFVTNACMGVFECVVTTIFVCCFRDASLYKGAYMSASMRKAFRIDPPEKGVDGGGAEEEAAPPGKQAPPDEAYEGGYNSPGQTQKV